MTKYGWIFIYFKPTDTRRCFPFSSNHSNPKHCKKNISFNQQQKFKHPSELKKNLKKYDYPVNMITNCTKKALKIPQNEFRKPKEK